MYIHKISSVLPETICRATYVEFILGSLNHIIIIVNYWYRELVLMVSYESVVL